VASPDDATPSLARELAQLAQTLQPILEQFGVGMFLTDLSGSCIFVNRACTAILDRPSDELLGVRWMESLHAGDRERLAAARERAVWDGTALKMDYRFVKPDGRIVWVERTSGPLRDAHGRIVGGLGALVDITARQDALAARERSERRFRALVEQSTVAIMESDLEGRCTYLNPHYRKLLELAPDAPLGFRWVDEFVHPDDRPHVRKLRDEAARAGTDLFLSGRIVSRSGVVRWVEGTSAPVLDEHGRIVGRLSSAIDVTSRKQAEAERDASARSALAAKERTESERRQLEGQLRQAEKMQAVGTLAGGIAHDFNNVLQWNLPSVETAQALLGPDHPARAVLDDVKKATLRASDLVRRLLTFSRSETSPRTVVNPAELVDEATKLLRSSLPATVSLRVRIDPAVPKVRSEESHIYEILMNLASNALQALPERRGSIDISLQPVQVEAGGKPPALADLTPGRYARLTVADDGVGMSEETVRRAFDPFFTTKPPGQGTGLGLSVVHGLVKAHGGTVIAESVVGRGTSIAVYLPAAAGEEPAVQRESEASPATERGDRVLWIDDEELIGRAMRRLLEGLGYEVTTSTDPVRALELLRSDPSRFDVLVTDFTMPGRTGLEVAREARSIRPDLPVILLTGDVSVVPRGDTAVREVISKPVTRDQIATALRRVRAGRPR